MNVEEEFSLSVYEELFDVNQAIKLRIETIDPSLCENSYMVLSSFDEGNLTKVNIQGIVDPEPCNKGVSSIREYVSLPSMNGAQSLEIILNDLIRNNGMVQISNESLSLEFADPKGIVVNSEKIHRIPKSAIWGFAASTELEQYRHALEFVHSLDQMCETFELVPGNYHYFNITKDGKFIPNDALDYPYRSDFIFNYSGDPNQLESFIGQFLSTNSERIQLKLYTGRGDIF